VIENARIYLKPKLKKIGSLWVCYTEWKSIPCTASTPEKAYMKWIYRNERAKFYL
jgi:hypothetical protein